ncbi:MAG: hypothetical protein WAV32_05435 [Halobacteriota archaeon]
MIEMANAILLCDWKQNKKADVLAKVIFDYCELGKLYDLKSLDLLGLEGEGSSSTLLLLGSLTNAAEEFVIAHEYGHIVNRHIMQNGEIQNIITDEREFDVLRKSKEQEFEADLWAIDALIRGVTYEKRDPDLLAIACGGPIVFIGTALLIEEYQKLKGKYIDTHPRASDRIYMIEAFYEIKKINEQGYIGRRFLELIGDCAKILLGRELTIPMLSRDLNRLLEKSLKNIRIDYEKTNWMKFQ